MDFIFMLTRQDRTVPNCLELMDEIRPLELRHIGFKDVGADRATLLKLTAKIREAGAVSYMEVVSTTPEACLNSAWTAVDIGVDRLLGGTDVDAVRAIVKHSEIEYFPFPGFPAGHPTELGGGSEDVEGHCREFVAKGCAGADLLAYRATAADPLELVRAARRGAWRRHADRRREHCVRRPDRRDRRGGRRRLHGGLGRLRGCFRGWNGRSLLAQLASIRAHCEAVSPAARRRRMSEPQRLSKKHRQDRILAELRASATIRISDLAGELGVSYETIRRDLEEMGQSGLINRTYGGAVARPFGFEPAWNERFGKLTEEREAIAALAARLVQPGEALMIDAGATTLHFARRLAAELKDLTIVTTSFAAAMALGANPSFAVISCPGRYDPHEGSVYGPDAIAFLGRFNANRVFMSASGITAEGPNEANSGAAAVKRAMLRRAEQRVLLLDSGKFDQPSLEVVCPLSDLHRLVCDAPPPRGLG